VNDQQTEQAILVAGLTAPRVTPAQINALMDKVIYVSNIPEGTTSTFVHAYLPAKTGRFWLATGHSACVSPDNFNPGIGHGIAMRKAQDAAKDKLWELEGYALFKELNQ